MNSPIAYQPTAKSLMFLSGDPSQVEKGSQTVDHGSCEGHSHKHACARRKLKMATIISFALAAVGICTFVLLCYYDTANDGLGGAMSFWKRALGSGNGTTGDQSPFTRDKRECIVD